MAIPFGYPQTLYHVFHLSSGSQSLQFPEIDVVVTHDDDWCSVLENDAELSNDEELFHRINHGYRVVTDGDGAFLISLSDHENLAQYPNTSTLLSASDDDHLRLDGEISETHPHHPELFKNDFGSTDEDYFAEICTAMKSDAPIIHTAKLLTLDRAKLNNIGDDISPDDGPEAFLWSVFYQHLGTWLLPWLSRIKLLASIMFRYTSIPFVFVLFLLTSCFLRPTAVTVNFSQWTTNIQRLPSRTTRGPEDNAAAVKVGQWIANVQKLLPGSTRRLDENPYLVANSSQAVAIAYHAYELCVSACGGGTEPFVWSVSAQVFSAWLLPWFALISQLPFGARLKSENLMSVLLAVGSPTLAAYSLILTVLNGRWITRKFASYTYPNTRHAVRVLSNLQQAPLIITKNGLLESLVVLPKNDRWIELADGLKYNHTWSMSAITTVVWVVTAYLFTVFTDINPVSSGHSISSVWLWLLPVVVGWLQISPRCDSFRLQRAIDRANAITYVAAADSKYPPVEASILSADRAFSFRIGSVFRDKECTAPIYNYARFFPWVQAVEEVSSAFRNADDNAKAYRAVNPYAMWKNGARKGEIDPTNRTGSLQQVEKYCRAPQYVRQSRWGSGVWRKIFVAGLLSLVLQWGTTGGAVITVGFGLSWRSRAYLIYAGISTLIWIIMVASSILAHYSITNTPDAGHCRLTTRIATVVSVMLRRLRKVAATFNTVWIVATSLFQFSNFFDRCFFNSIVFGLGDRAYGTIDLSAGNTLGMKSAWVGGVGLALGSALIFIGFVNRCSINPP